MSEKIILTEEQVKAVELFKAKERDTWEYLVRRKAEKSFHLEYKPFNEMTLDDIVQAVFVGYEIEPKFKLDDLVVTIYENQRNVTGRVTKIIGDDCVRIRYSDNGEIRNRGHYPEYLRHATKEEIIWAELGREVGEFGEGDTYVRKNGNIYQINNLYGERKGIAKTAYKEGKLKGFYPANSFIKFP